ncbi:uncharacterized protein VTP21DRAFT_9651 [Calcarisporiella thermophila]|uniref:uncharacterized protein n=1 Tax=Calcarisporiella thermophila TaxID=911321 RepID=UPI003742A3DC
MILSLFSLILCISTISLTAIAQRCRCQPGDTCWPTDQLWERFNASVGGHLLSTTPIAYPCHDPHYNEAACDLVKKNWNDALWREEQPGGLVWTGWEIDGNIGCLNTDNRTTPCLQGAVPVYSVNVTSGAEIQKAVIFAAQHNLRIIIKNTGHDFLGRSTAPGSLSIWTHYLRNITFYDSFIPEGCNVNQGTSAVTVEAGVRWGDVYRAAETRKLVIVGGSSLTVGAAGGYVQGGGHSPLSPTFGLSADNILQYTVVTADGQLRIANACQNKDLFWALRGGGGGTFGVVISATHKTHKAPDNVIGARYIINATDLASYKDILRTFIKITPYLSDAGWGGYFNLKDKQISINYLSLGTNTTFAKDSFATLVNIIKYHTGVSYSENITAFSSFYDWQLSKICHDYPSCKEPAGYNVQLSSRLIPRKNFETDADVDQLADILSKIIKNTISGVIGNFVAGGAVARAGGNDTSVNPAWRKALWHVYAMGGTMDNATEVERKYATQSLRNATQPLRDITPGSGCYVNEADPNEPNWQFAFFGSNYQQLREVKKEIDPTDLFTCNKCVGSEYWTENLNCLAH